MMSNRRISDLPDILDIPDLSCGGERRDQTSRQLLKVLLISSPGKQASEGADSGIVPWNGIRRKQIFS